MDQMKERKVSSYGAQNIELAASDWITNYKELHGASMYNPNTTMYVVNARMEAGGSSEDFRYKIWNVKDQLETELQEVRYMDYQAAHQHLVKKNLDLKSILRTAKD